MEESLVEKNNRIDIELASRTLSFIGLVQNHIPSDLFKKMRPLVANLVDFQNRFAKPMLLPFQLGNDLQTSLEVVRPFQVLDRFKIVFPLGGRAEGNLALDDCLDENGVRYFYVGGNTWRELNSKGLLSGIEAVQPTITAWMWLPYLFRLLSLGATINLEVKAEARRLAACWAHVASQIDYSALPEDEEEQYDPTPLIQSLTISAKDGMNELLKDPTLLDQFASEDEDDDDFVPDESSEHSEEEEEEGEEADEMNVEKGEGDDDDLPPLEEVGIQYERPAPVELNEIQKTIFETVQVLQAYMPDPDTDIEWFKRVLKDVKVAQVTGEKQWYPFGCPPMEPLIECLKQDQDPYAKQMASAIILLFKSQMTN